MKKKKKWRVIAPLAATAFGALAAGTVTLLQKLPKAPAPAGEPAEKPAALMTGSYSFISGFQDAAAVEVKLDYDPEKYSFIVMEDGFLNYSGDSHVAVVCGEEFDLQLEYAAYYSGEDFAAHRAALAEKYGKCGEFACGALAGVWVRDGDNVAIHLPIPGDAHSYLLVTVQKTAAYKDEVTTLPDYAPLRELLGTLRFERS